MYMQCKKCNVEIKGLKKNVEEDVAVVLISQDHFQLWTKNI